MQISPILRQAGDRLLFRCPGCEELHQVTVNSPNAKANWSYNGNAQKPTFVPSILVTGKRRLNDEEYERVMAGEIIETEPTRCHSFVTEGKIQFLTDCTHKLAGQTVDIPLFDDRID